MKNSQIHNGLDSKEMRDFISNSFVINFDSETSLEKPKIPYDSSNPIMWSIRNKEAEIEMNIKHLKLLKEKQALIEIMNMRGWSEHDVSDETEKDSHYTLKMNFIGTEEEYNTFINSLKK